jgi:hypothetical protein
MNTQRASENSYSLESERRQQEFLDGSLADFLKELRETPLSMMDSPDGASLEVTTRTALRKMVEGWMDRELTDRR